MAEKPRERLVEGDDYVIDPATGLMVLTAAYLERRGYCCESGCRNCPYGFEGGRQGGAARGKDKTKSGRESD